MRNSAPTCRQISYVLESQDAKMWVCFPFHTAITLRVQAVTLIMWTTKMSVSIWGFTEEVNLTGVQLSLGAKSIGISSKLFRNQAD